MNIKINTANGNLFVSSDEESQNTLFGFFDKNFQFLRWSDEDEWKNASENWGLPEESFLRKRDLFPLERELAGVRYRFFNDKRGIIHRLIEINSDSGNPLYEHLNFHQAICVKGKMQIEFRTEADIKEGQRYYKNLQASFEEAKKEIALLVNDTEKHIDAMGINEDGKVVAYRYACDKDHDQCGCTGSWWSGDKSKVCKTVRL